MHCLRLSLLRTKLVIISLALMVTVSACGKSGGNASGVADESGIIVVNAPVTGEVRRILVSEGVSVGSGAPIIEIAVRAETPLATPSPGESAEARAARNLKAADAEIEAARTEAVRHDAEVQRLTPLVASGEASAAQLEGERALFERAQRRLQQAQDAKRNAEGGLLTARSNEQNQTSTPAAPREQLVAATASSAGTVTVINARVGEMVKAGQPLATLRSND